MMTLRNAGSQILCATALMVAAMHASTVLHAQVVCLPLPRLLTTVPMGGQVGTQVEMKITGENIEDVEALLFNHPGLTAAPQLDANGVPEADKFIVTIAADCPPGLYEARLMTRLGISSPRIFSVGTMPEVTQSTPNKSLETAMAIPVNSVCNAVMSERCVDHYSFQGQQGHRYIANCAARGIDSKLDAVLIIADDAGRDLLVERRGGTLDFTAPSDGTFVIKLHDLTFRGGAALFYRLTLQELPADAALPLFASTLQVNTFSWPPVGLPETAPLQESEPNPVTAPQQITLPCDLSGSFFPAADVDTFEFEATKGDIWWIEVASERLGRPTDASALVQLVKGAGAEQSLRDVAEFTDIPSPVRVSSNGYAYDGPPYNGGSADINGKLEIPEDGRYRLQITDLFGGTRNDPRNIYRLVIRKAAPDFALAAWGLHMELRNGDRNALSKPLALRGGSTVALEVIALRRDGFDGEIELVMDGLPDGVTAQGLKIPAGKSRGILLLTADQNAPRALTNVSFFGRSVINEAEVTRPCRLATHAWPIVDSWGEIPYPRLVSDCPVSVTGSEFAPISVAAREKKTWEVVAGEKLTIPLVLTRRSEFSGAVLQLKTFGEGFEQNSRFDVSLTADTADAVLDLGQLKTAPGNYLIAFYGSAVAKYRYHPDAVTAAEAAHQQAVDAAAAAAAEVQRLTEAAAAAAAETKADADKAVAEATTRKQAADAAVTAAAATLKAATDRATPRDTVDIVISEPIPIQVK